jgi:hypothetical protein
MRKGFERMRLLRARTLLTPSQRSTRGPLMSCEPAVPRGAQLLESLRAQAAALWGAINQRGILLPAVFVFLWQVCPTPNPEARSVPSCKHGARHLHNDLAIALQKSSWGHGVLPRTLFGHTMPRSALPSNAEPGTH